MSISNLRDQIKNLVIVAENSCGSNFFRNYYVQGRDILADGDLSCAWYVSTVLVAVRLIDGVSFKVNGLLHRLDESDQWKKYLLQECSLESGDIIVWDPIEFRTNWHYHVGFYLDDDIAVSNRSISGQPGKHSIRYTGLGVDGQLHEARIHCIYKIQ